MFAFTFSSHAQAYIERSEVISASGTETVAGIAVDAGFSYILGTATSNDYPITFGGTPTGSAIRSVLTKLDPTGKIVWSRYLPFNTVGAANNIIYSEMVLDNGVLYLAGQTTATNIPTTDGSTAHGAEDILFTTVNPSSGAVLYNGYLGGSGSDFSGMDLKVDNGNAYIAYTTNSPNIPVTTGPVYTAGFDMVVQKINASGVTSYCSYIGQVGTSAALIAQISLSVENGIAFLACRISSPHNFITTDGTLLNAAGTDFGIVRLDPSGNKNFATLIGGANAENYPELLVHNGEIYLAGQTSSTNYPVTDGSVKGSSFTYVLTKWNSNGQIVYSGYRGSVTTGIGATSEPRLRWKNGAVYMAFASPVGNVTITPTDGSTGGVALLKIDPVTGIQQFATRFGQLNGGGNSSYVNMAIDDDGIYSVSYIQAGGGTPTGTAFTTDGSQWNTNTRTGTFVTKHSLDGKLLYASFLVGAFGNLPGAIFYVDVSGGKMYVSGRVNNSNTFPVTSVPYGQGVTVDNTWTVYSFCPPMPTQNDISPLSQSSCVNGVVQSLTGNAVVYQSSQMPTLYVNGVGQQQPEIRARYQWQVATSGTGPWTAISGGTQRDYLPPAGAQTFYYRRLVLPPAGCGETPISISAVAEVIIGANAAPTVTGAVFNTCANTSVNISATVSGGTTPYTYAWDNGISSITNTASVTPTSNSVYTLTVTDANGCKQIGQAIVNAYVADAGPAAVSSCAGQPVRIGAAPPAGLTGVTYSWMPTTGLDDPTAAQPLATPVSNTVYTLQMTVPITGGGTCTTNDNVTVNVIAAPVTPNFAGADQATCKGGTLTIGTAAEAGFTYTWSPGSYLNSVTTSTTTYNPGTSIPATNPITYSLTASKSGCSFIDQVKVAVLDVDAGEDYCGPRTVGAGDKVPGVTGKTFTWQVISGPGTITGATNTATTTVSASASLTTYRLTVSYLGASCSDDVVVGPCGSGGCPVMDIKVVAKNGCPSSAFGPVTLNAIPGNLSPAYTYTWSSVPAGGLSTTSGNTITLTDNVERDVTVTVSRVDNPAVTCSHTIHVNDPSWSLPAFTVQDATICPGVTTAIGAAPVAGYTYQWTGVSAAQINASNPNVSPTSTTSYPVEVEDVASGCRLVDTAVVTVKPFVINPGPDWVACSNSLITLGSPALPGYTYSWNPQIASYQSGTTYQSAEPKVLIAATQDFTLTVTDSESGCTADSTAHITIDASSTLPSLGDTTICPGGTATIGMPAWSGVGYSWSPAIGLSSTTVAQPQANPSSTQVYTLTVTYFDQNGAPTCTKSGSVTVTVNAPQITLSDDAICPSGPLYNLSTGVSVTGASTYSWSPSVLVNNPGSLSTTVKTNPNTPTTFSLTATDANGCTATANKLVSPTNTAPEAGSNGVVCLGSSRTLGASSNSGTLSWTVTPAIAGTLSPLNGAETVFTPAAGDLNKTFIFKITQNIGGCINVDSSSMQVRGPVIPAMPAKTACLNTPVTIGVTALEGVTYAWYPTTGLADPNAATTTITNLTSNSVYTLTATDVYGCSATANAVVGTSSFTAPSVTIPDVTVMMGSPGSPFSPQVSPMPASYTYTWSPAQTLDNPYIANARATPISQGTQNYQLTITDQNGCTTVAPARLNVITSSTLPVTISSFTASPTACGVRLNWKVESVERFSAFVVERKGSSGTYKEIHLINHDPSRTQYQFDDVDPGNGGWAYRLRLVDQDGRFRYSSTVFATVNCTAGEKLIIYPNPVNNYISIKSSKAVSSLTVLSITGQIMMKKEYRQTQPGLIVMPVERQLPQGIYFLQVRASDGTVQNVKLIKE